MVSAEASLRELGIRLPQAPKPFGAYVEAVRTGNLLFLTGMLPIENQKPKFVGRIGKELDGTAGREAAKLAALNALAVAREYLGSLDKVTRVVRLGVYISRLRVILLISQRWRTAPPSCSRRYLARTRCHLGL
jgi:enamine deaminase RidA (YjgF/YER057c/UK114 family)